MSSILTSQIETVDVNNSKAASLVRELVAIVTMFSVTATIVILTSLTWVA